MCLSSEDRCWNAILPSKQCCEHLNQISRVPKWPWPNIPRAQPRSLETLSSKANCSTHILASIRMRILSPLSYFWLFLAPLVISAQDNTTTANTTETTTDWLGCVDPSRPNAKIEIGKKTIVCLLIGNSKDWSDGVSYTRVSFQPEADQYSRLHIPNCKTSHGVFSLIFDSIAHHLFKLQPLKT